MPKILLMEDNEHQALLLSEWLEAEGYDVCAALSLEEAIAHLDKKTRFDLVITDIFVPRAAFQKEIERGVTLIEHIRKSEDACVANLPIISMSGVRIERSYAYRFDDPKSFGANVHLAKPINFEILSRTIAKLVEPSQRIIIEPKLAS